ncbi:hypothetical protein [Acidisphaera sp. S103]|uniref:hypothetical protein n=1 Tax=Acidisphaera sp. S103 TaxID=1747223 RepID=UPI00131C75CE|nr:hypothetical protein [Acidisphaera sp. S103]
MAGEFDTLTLRRRANEWRDEAVRVPAGPMRVFCLREAWQCERRLRASANTPVIYERGIESGWSTEVLGSIDLFTAARARTPFPCQGVGISDALCR